MKILIRFAPALVLLSLLGTGCGGPAPTQAPALPSAAPAASATPKPTSTPRPTPTVPPPTYTPGGPFPTGMYKPGSVIHLTSLEFREDGTWSTTAAPGGIAVSGTYVVDGETIVLDFRNNTPCAGFPNTYTWSFDGIALALRTIEDKCPLEPSRDFRIRWFLQP